MTEFIWSHDQSSPQIQSPKPVANNSHRHRCKNVFRLLAQREISPKTKFVPRKRWGESRWDADWLCGISGEPVSQPRHNLISLYLCWECPAIIQVRLCSL